jgi:hypothetical protein
MNLSAVEQVARAVLYEGYLLYPYRPSALKNRQRWMFGRVCPRDWSLAHQGAEPWIMQTECLVAGTPETSLSFAVRFLQIATRTHDPDTPAAADDDAVQSAVEREVAGEVVLREALEPGTPPRQFPFKFLTDRESQSSERRRSFKACQPLEGIVEAAAIRTASGLYRCTISIRNLTPVESPAACLLDETLLRSLVSTHTILGVAGGEFVSLLDPPETQRAEAEACRNIGTFPVLVGAAGARSMMLSSPIILYDYPQVAAQSPGDLFDSTEIDELLTLRIQTLTDEEKREMSAADERTRLLLARTGSLSEQQFLDLHAEMRPSGRTFHVGDRVRLRPKGRADAFDLLLDGSAATVVSIEHDFEDRLHVCVVIDADPGKDFGVAGLPGHRFFFRPEEVELLAGSSS